MSTQIEQAFNERVFGGICQDFDYYLEKAKRDIRIQRSVLGKLKLVNSHPNGQVLATLGLMAYTEYVGLFVPDIEKTANQQGVISKRQHFDAFFRRLGPKYQQFLQNEAQQQRSVYGWLRSAMVHSYFGNDDCTIAIPNSGPNFEVKGNPPESIERPVDVGIGLAPNGNYYIVVEKYYDDFRAACEQLLIDLQNMPPTSPPPSSPPIYTGYAGTTGGVSDTS